ncbi:MAG TPA: hypothetical protein VLT84_01420, partial [Acidobacteriota bacterium]|nr:hypothetical protein [Acidobacteriota bacterium]
MRPGRVPAVGQRDLRAGETERRLGAKLGRDAEPFQPSRPRRALRYDRRAREEFAAPDPSRGFEAGAPPAARRRL